MTLIGQVYLIPTTLGSSDNLSAILPLSIKNNIEQIKHFIVEREKTARHFIKHICPDKKQSDLTFFLIDKHTPTSKYNDYLNICQQGYDIGILSEAGLPAIADPGAIIVSLAHKRQIKVTPLVGPSSIFLALMSSGLNGQNFAFNGYLPIHDKNKKTKIKQLEHLVLNYNQTQIFIETPYRNEKLFDSLIKSLSNHIVLSIACDLTLSNEYICSKTVQDWKKSKKPSLHKRPTIFLIGQY